MLSLNKRAQGGFTLVEMMVGMVIGIIVLSGALYIFIGNSESNLYQLRSTRFVQQMRDVMDRMVADVRRAGYLGYLHFVNVNTVSLENVFAAKDVGGSGINTLLTVSKRSGEAVEKSCVTYAYNLDDDYPAQVGTATSGIAYSGFDPSSSAKNELFGFQLRNDEIWIRAGMGGDTTFDCDSGSWRRVTDNEVVVIESLQFELSNTECLNATDETRNDCSGGNGNSDDNPKADDFLVWVQQLSITMTGHSAADAGLRFTLSQKVDIQNHFVEQLTVTVTPP